MILCDVNVLVYAYREDAPEHPRYLDWLEDVIAGQHVFGLCDLVLSGFLRIVTHPKVFNPPSPVNHAREFVEQLRGAANCALVAPGPRHWSIFQDLLDATGAKGNLIPDAFLAALAIEHGCEWVTSDRDFARFPGLNWSHPLHQKA